MIRRCSFQDKFTLEERTKESARVREKYNNKIPVIIEAISDKIKPIDKTKYLVPSDMTMGQLLFVVRKRIKLESTEALYLMVEKPFQNILVAAPEKRKSPQAQQKSEK